MDKNLHNIEDLFRSSLEDNEDEIPSKKVWDTVDKRLDKDNIVSMKKKYTNLKRLAIMLLLFLVSFALHDVYKMKVTLSSNGLTKNSETNRQVNRNDDDKLVNNGLNKKSETNSPTTTDTNNRKVHDEENVLTRNSVQEDNTLINRQKLQPTNKQILQKQIIGEANNSGKDILETITDLASHKKKKLNTRSSYQVKITNPDGVDKVQNLVQNNDELWDHENSPLRRLKNVSIESLQLLPNDSISKNKLNQLKAISKIKITDTSNNAIVHLTKMKDGKPSRFSITPFFSPDIAWYHLQNDNLDNQPDNAAELDREEKHEFSSTFGALVDYKLNKHWGLQSGLTLSNINITVDPKTIYAQQDNMGSVKYRINTSSGYGYLLPKFIQNPAIGDSLYAFTSTHSLLYIGIPLVVTYSLTKGKFKFNGRIGLAANILSKAKLETTVEKGFDNTMETVDNLQGLKKVYFSGLAGVGVDYKLANKISLTFVPTMRFALNSINKNVPVKSFPMSFGFSMGLKIEL